MPKEELRDAKTVFWILRGSQRRFVFEKLTETFTPNKLRKDINKMLKTPLHLREMSRHLKDFEGHGLVKCMDPNAPYNKPYMLTEKGAELQRYLRDKF